MKKFLKAAAVTLTALLLAVTINAGVAYAHGYTTDPVSRAEWCARGMAGDCGGVQFEPQSVEGPKGFPGNVSALPDGSICNANLPNWQQLNAPAAPNGEHWPVTTVHADTPFTFTWILTAPHPTASFRYFITQEDWNPERPLTRADLVLEAFLTVPFGGAVPPPAVTNVGTLPDRSGRALILSVWEIAGTDNAYYQCADVFFI